MSIALIPAPPSPFPAPVPSQSADTPPHFLLNLHDQLRSLIYQQFPQLRYPFNADAQFFPFF